MGVYMAKTNIDDFIKELGAGTVKEKLALILSEAAFSSVTHGNKQKVGKVSIEFKFIPVGDQGQVLIEHKLLQTVITPRGKKTNEDTTESHFWVGKGGELTVDQPEFEISGQRNFELRDINNED